MLKKIKLNINKFLIFYILLYFSCLYPNSIKLELQEKIKSIPKWISNQLADDFANSSIYTYTQEMIEETRIKERGSLAIFRIMSGKVIIKSDITDLQSVYRYWCKFMYNIFKELSNYVNLPDVDFVLNLSDRINSSNYSVPVLVCTKRKIDKNSILIPNWYAFYSSKKNVIEQVKVGNKKYPWHTKKEKAFWRGSNTGGIYTILNYESKPRVKLAAYSKIYPELIDAKFNNIMVLSGGKRVSTQQVKEKLLELNYFDGSKIPMSEHMQYKYQIVVDGYVLSWGREYWQPFSNSAILKQTSEHLVWSSCLFKPYLHYIPINNGLDDILEKIYWAKDNDDKVQKMVMEANKVAEDSMNYADMLLYLYAVIVNYAKLQKI